MAAPPAAFVKNGVAEREKTRREPLNGCRQQNVTAVCAKVYYWTAKGSMPFARHQQRMRRAYFATSVPAVQTMAPPL
jgi:hypothetical protein